jgi:hypothetical protein
VFDSPILPDEFGAHGCIDLTRVSAHTVKGRTPSMPQAPVRDLEASLVVGGVTLGHRPTMPAS